MKRALLLGMLLVAQSAAACNKGCEEHQGVCACDQKPDAAPDVQAASEEQPPKDKMPSYQREGIHADMPASTAGADARMDADRLAADQAGKKAAGVE